MPIILPLPKRNNLIFRPKPSHESCPRRVLSFPTMRKLTALTHQLPKHHFMLLQRRRYILVTPQAATCCQMIQFTTSPCCHQDLEEAVVRGGDAVFHEGPEPCCH